MTLLALAMGWTLPNAAVSCYGESKKDWDCSIMLQKPSGHRNQRWVRTFTIFRLRPSWTRQCNFPTLILRIFSTHFRVDTTTPTTLQCLGLQVINGISISIWIPHFFKVAECHTMKVSNQMLPTCLILHEFNVVWNRYLFSSIEVYITVLPAHMVAKGPKS